MTQNESISRLDRILLKGFYTNDKDELENPSILKSSGVKKEPEQREGKGKEVDWTLPQGTSKGIIKNNAS